MKTNLLSSSKWTRLFLSLGLVFACALLRAKAADSSPTPPGGSVNYQEGPISRTDYGLVRVWNAKGEPPQGAGHVPEATLGDSLIAEVKQIDAWLIANLEAGAWSTDTEAIGVDPLVRKVIEAHTLATTVRAGKWLSKVKKAEDSRSAPEDAATLDPKNVVLLADLKKALEWDDSKIQIQDENGRRLDPVNPKEASRIVETYRKAVSLVTDLRERKATQFILSINDTALPGLSVSAQEPQANWRSAKDRKEEGDYTFWRIRLRASDDPDLDKAWSDLMHAVEPHFSLQSRLSLSAPGQLVPMETNVTATTEDSRCRFVFIAIKRLPRSEKKLEIGEAVYPLDLRERTNEVRKGEIVEVEKQDTGAPYVVHFSEAGGSKHYAGKDLALLPPDPVPQGVVRVWNLDAHDPAWEEAQKNEIPSATIGDHLVVEVRNFDGWLCNQIDQGLLREDPLIKKASKNLLVLIDAKNFSDAVKVGGAIYRLSHKTRNTSADIVRQLQKEGTTNPDFAGLPFPTLGRAKLTKIGELKDAPVLATPSPSASPGAEPNKEPPKKDDETIAKQFLAPYQEAHSLLRELVKAKLRALNLTVNDLVLGITADNSDFTPIYQSRRPAGNPDEDTYHWLQFAFSPKAIAHPKEGEKAAEDPFARLMEKPDFTMPSKVTLTLKSGSETLTLPTAVTPQAQDKRSRFNLIGIRLVTFWLITIFFAVIAILLGLLVAKTDIVRDPCRHRPEGVEPLSLARTQMAFWFVVIAAAFLFLWVTTGNISTINTTCLVLLAIGTTTAVASAKLGERNQGTKDLAYALGETPHAMLKKTPKKILDAIAKKTAELKAMPAGQITADEKAALITILECQQKDIVCFIAKKPKWLHHTIYFWGYRLRSVHEDLLTEEGGTYDFQRFQVLAWTLILGLVFIVKVFSDRVMPTFDTNVLLLMGISSGAYLTFKKVGTDQKKEKTDDTPPAAEPAAAEKTGSEAGK